ncbi:RagB/SusD family nutrient uptake outer membrane protein [Pedobacter psychrodurus]|uniref:RagB/SusD family nutrient uptake outer membrane protein n=1 Tax=Pedobacter psychrodurus TaxID=2530456 RepID=UPI00292E54C9|nr:RagB/SusD family nutrient uptake outer membrane protein [Pedobacter psychrodurus]
MKTKYINNCEIYIAVIILALFTACKKNFLDTTPPDRVVPENFFNSASDLRIYLNSMYESRLPVYNAQTNVNNVLLDLQSDVLINSNVITGSLNQVSATGVAGNGGGGDAWATGYSRIRQDNYLLHYALPKVEKTPASAHYLSEAYFFRALDYFTLLKQYGDLPIVTDLIAYDDNGQLYTPRNSRYDVAKQIIKDLDLAIAGLYAKGQGEAAAGRVNKESAIVLKSRVALYEGTWEYYHGKKGSPFAVAGKDGREFLEMVEPAMQQLIATQGTRIFRTGTEPYNQLFAQNDLSNVDGVFWYRVYDPTKTTFSHNFYVKVIDNAASITDHLVDQYLNKDGSPQVVPNSYGELNTLSTNLDPRFRQTIWTPDRGPAAKIPGRDQFSLNLRYPVIAPVLSIGTNFISTGYRNWKGAVLTSVLAGRDVDEIFIRYEEGLLNLAEAKAILGTITQADLDKTVNVIRSRVGMANMNLATVAGFPLSAYKEELGFSPSESNIVNEIRRERTVELALEGFRLDDLKRWSVYEKVVNGYTPRGAQLQEFLTYFNDRTKLIADGFDVGGITFPLLNTSGGNANVAAFANTGRINPYFKSSQFQQGAQGFFIDPSRDYLTFVPLSQIQLYKAENVVLTQNPGWR